MTSITPAPHLRGLAIAAFCIGLVAAVLGIASFILSRINGPGHEDLSFGTVIMLWVASMTIGFAAIAVGIVSTIMSRPRLLGWLGLVLGLVPFVGLAVGYVLATMPNNSATP